MTKTKLAMLVADAALKFDTRVHAREVIRMDYGDGELLDAADESVDEAYEEFQKLLDKYRKAVT